MPCRATRRAAGSVNRAEMSFAIATSNLDHAVTVVSVVGEADLSTAPDLKRALAGAIDGGSKGVLVDLSRATFIDSTTLGTLMGAVKRLRPAGGELAITCRNPDICKIFEITLLDRVLPIFDSVDAGVVHLRARADGSREQSGS